MMEGTGISRESSGSQAVSGREEGEGTRRERPESARELAGLAGQTSHCPGQAGQSGGWVPLPDHPTPGQLAALDQEHPLSV